MKKPREASGYTGCSNVPAMEFAKLMWMVGARIAMPPPLTWSAMNLKS
jgi:hypothetical protein